MNGMVCRGCCSWDVVPGVEIQMGSAGAHGLRAMSIALGGYFDAIYCVEISLVSF